MPEMMTKYPEVALKILKEAHIKCGTALQPKILTTCPKQNFCSLPTGELCVYSIKDISKMTQIHPADVLFLPASIALFIPIVIMILCLGMIIGIKIK